MNVQLRRIARKLGLEVDAFHTSDSPCVVRSRRATINEDYELLLLGFWLQKLERMGGRDAMVRSGAMEAMVKLLGSMHQPV